MASDLKQKVREIVASKMLGSKYLRETAAAFYSSGYRDALAPLTEEEQGEIAREIAKAVNKSGGYYLASADAALSALRRIRGIET
jgi:hypothetical protein